jgi:hypothetical protein
MMVSPYVTHAVFAHSWTLKGMGADLVDSPCFVGCGQMVDLYRVHMAILAEPVD